MVHKDEHYDDVSEKKFQILKGCCGVFKPGLHVYVFGCIDDSYLTKDFGTGPVYSLSTHSCNVILRGNLESQNYVVFSFSLVSHHQTILKGSNRFYRP